MFEGHSSATSNPTSAARKENNISSFSPSSFLSSFKAAAKPSTPPPSSNGRFNSSSAMNSHDRYRQNNTPSPSSSINSNNNGHTNTIFGMPLAAVLARSNKTLKRADTVPKIALECMAFIEEKGMDELGIYRLSGSTKEINLFRGSYNAFMTVDFYIQQYTDPNAVASLFKAYVRELPECLLGENVTAFQDLFTRFSDVESCFKDSITLESGKDHPILHNEELLAALEHLIHTNVTAESRDFLAVFLRHLRRISLNEAVNKMGLNNLQVVWSPTLRFGGALFMMLILQHERLFPLHESSHSIIAPPPAAAKVTFSDNVVMMPHTPPKSESSSLHSIKSSDSGRGFDSVTRSPSPVSKSKSLPPPPPLSPISASSFSAFPPISIPARGSSSLSSPTRIKASSASGLAVDVSRKTEFNLPPVASISTSPLPDFSSFRFDF